VSEGRIQEGATRRIEAARSSLYFQTFPLFWGKLVLVGGAGQIALSATDDGLEDDIATESGREPVPESSFSPVWNGTVLIAHRSRGSAYRGSHVGSVPRARAR
jgi:hypothetical protein